MQARNENPRASRPGAAARTKAPIARQTDRPPVAAFDPYFRPRAAESPSRSTAQYVPFRLYGRTDSD